MVGVDAGVEQLCVVDVERGVQLRVTHLRLLRDRGVSRDPHLARVSVPSSVPSTVVVPVVQLSGLMLE